MRALTIQQPWADAIAHGEKRTENRSWTTKHRSDILIHAGTRYDPMGRFVITDRGALNSWPDTRGAVVAVARLEDIHHGTATCCPTWGFPDVYHWQLTNVRTLPEPVPAKGRQQLWIPSDEVLAAVQRQLEAVSVS